MEGGAQGALSLSPQPSHSHSHSHLTLPHPHPHPPPFTLHPHNLAPHALPYALPSTHPRCACGHGHCTACLAGSGQTSVCANSRSTTCETTLARRWLVTWQPQHQPPPSRSSSPSPTPTPTPSPSSALPIGEKVAFYFAWLEHYTIALLILVNVNWAFIRYDTSKDSSMADLVFAAIFVRLALFLTLAPTSTPTLIAHHCSSLLIITHHYSSSPSPASAPTPAPAPLTAHQHLRPSPSPSPSPSPFTLTLARILTFAPTPGHAHQCLDHSLLGVLEAVQRFARQPLVHGVLRGG